MVYFKRLVLQKITLITCLLLLILLPMNFFFHIKSKMFNFPKKNKHENFRKIIWNMNEMKWSFSGKIESCVAVYSKDHFETHQQKWFDIAFRLKSNSAHVRNPFIVRKLLLKNFHVTCFEVCFVECFFFLYFFLIFCLTRWQWR